MSHFRKFVFALASVSLFCLCSISALAQSLTTGSIVGTVTDPSGAVITGAKVTIKSLDRGSTKTTDTNATGGFGFSLLDPGSYSVTVSAPNFKTQTQTTSVVIGQTASLKSILELGSTETVVEVSGQAAMIQTEDGNQGSSINELQAANVPNPGNDLTYMADIAPGTVMNTAGGGLGNFSSYGMSATSNLFTVNGMDDNDPFLNLNNSGATNLMLGQNEVQEVAVVTNGYSGAYGGLAGANINYITRGGTNNFHGRATWYWNGDRMNANSWFNNAQATPRPFVNANQYGADIGGPIVKNKLFFYFNAEGLYLVIPTSVQAIIPSPGFATATQANIDSIFGPTSASDAFYKNMFTLYAGAPGASRATNSLPGGGCDPSASSATDPGSALASVATPFGATNPCALAFQSTVGAKTHEHLEAGRIDWIVSGKDRLFGRVQHDRGLQATVTDAINPLFNTVSDQPEWQGQFQETHTFSATATNQLILSAQWYRAIFGQVNPTASFAAFPSTLLMASGQLSNMGGLDFIFPQGRDVSQGQISDDVSWVRGSHTWKFGFKARRNWTSDHDFGVLSTGLIVPLSLDAFYEGGFDPTTGGNGDFTLNQQNFPKFNEARMQNYTMGGYAEDDWKATKNLLVTLSLRLDHQSNPLCVQKCFVQTAVPFPQLSTSATTPYNQMMKINQSQMLPDLTKIEPQPRVGFAWQVANNTVVRGGVGIFYDLFPAVQFDNFAENPPNDPQFITAFDNLTPGETCGGTCSNIFADAAASNAAFQGAFTGGGSFSTLGGLAGAFTAPGLASSEAHPKVPQYQKWSLEVEHQLGRNTSLKLGYVGNHGVHIFFLNNGINGCQPGAAFGTLPACGSPAPGVTVEPNPSFASVGYGQSIGLAKANNFTASFTHRYSSGLVQVNYTYGHSFDTDSNSGITGTPFSTTAFGATNNSIQVPEDPFNPLKYNYASSDQDVRHSINANYVWELPIKRFITFGHGPDRLLKGWDVNGDLFFRTGFPFTLVDSATSSALSSTGYSDTIFGNVLAAGGSGFSCTAAATAYAAGGTPKVEPGRNICLAPILGQPGDKYGASTGTYGNVGRNTIRGPHYFMTDFSLMKHIKIWERSEFVFGAQFFNVFNHPNFDAPIVDTSNPQFGLITRTVSGPTTIFGSVLGADASPRLIQLKTQLTF